MVLKFVPPPNPPPPERYVYIRRLIPSSPIVLVLSSSILVHALMPKKHPPSDDSMDDRSTKRPTTRTTSILPSSIIAEPMISTPVVTTSDNSSDTISDTLNKGIGDQTVDSDISTSFTREPASDPGTTSRVDNPSHSEESPSASTRTTTRQISSLCDWDYKRPLSLRIHKMSTYNSESTGHCGITSVPDNTAWGHFNTEDDVHRFLCLNGKPITIWLVGKIQRNNTRKGYNSPSRLSIGIYPVVEGDAQAAIQLLDKYASENKKQPLDRNPIWASKYMEKTLKTGERQAIPFKESYNAMDRLGPKSQMQYL
ncbi:hypothetical protein SCP_0207670 [Sparassis crispa]|uniref:Uncharacterized protein n=1 Tax=Sparassis crispa TaxID=139825 RepID=A0A401GBP1_9APHY|nr:hypothetical protein SCP_0207670 [Sparassis crispa]GBE79567.1 hypothetical protein SCP_0207670 [Sparassis crispa]